MKQSFSDYCKTKPQKDQMIADIQNHAITLCGALYDDVKFNELRYHNQAIDLGESPEYHKKRILEIDSKGVDHEFFTEVGRKYIKIVHRMGTSRSVHAFVDKTTGDVYKPASWKAPAKHVRYNLVDDNSREECLKRCDWAGGYLYMR
jgi:hypothetical protein